MIALKRASMVALGLLALVGCEKEEPPAPKAQEVILNVRTVDTANQPVEMVRFYINGKKFGITDQDGAFKGKFPAKNGDSLQFNVEPPQGYSVPANVDPNQWNYTVAYPADGRPLQIDFIATLQRPEKDYLFMVRTEQPGEEVVVNAKRVGKTGASGNALLRVTGVPGAPFTAKAGGVEMSGAFAEEDEIYLLTAKKAGALGGDDAPAAAPPAAPPSVAAVEPPQADPPAEVEPPPAAPEPPPAAPEPPPAAPEPPPVVAAREPTPPAADLFAAAQPAPRQERRAAAPREPAPRFEPEPPPADDPEPPPAVEPDPPPAPVAKGGSGLDELFDDPGEAPGLGAVDAPPPAAAPPEPPADVAALLDDPVAEVPTAPPVIAAAPPAERKRPENADLGGGILEDDGDVVDKSAINKKVSVAGGSAPSAAGMGREEISDRLDGIKANLARTQVLSRGDVDFLAQIDQTHPGYHEANRLLADYYYKLKDYKRQTAALEVATKRGRYKHDPNVLLSLAKAYAQVKNFRKALSTMRRVEAKMRRLPADQKADAYRFHAEILEFEFQRQFNDDPKRANVTLVDKAISMWERYETFSRGANPGAVARAQGKIRELNELKSRVEL